MRKMNKMWGGMAVAAVLVASQQMGTAKAGFTGAGTAEKSAGSSSIVAQVIEREMMPDPKIPAHKLPPDPVAGKETAIKLCSSCHIVPDANASGAVQVGIPSFRTIANKPDQTAGKLTNKIIAPHPPMPDTHLTHKEVKDIVAFIMQLREADKN